jgi:hypothetical protein
VLAFSAGCHGAPPEVAVVPGLSVSAVAFPSADTVIYRRSITRSGQDSTAGTRTVVRQLLTAAVEAGNGDADLLNGL